MSRAAFGGRLGGFSRGRGGGGRSPGGRFGREDGPPAAIVESGLVVHECESELVCKWTIPEKVPYFNAAIFLENKRKIGKVDEILGKISDVLFTVKMDPGIHAKSFKPGDMVYIGTDKLLPLARFIGPCAPKAGGRGRGGGSSFRGGIGRGIGGRSPGRGRGAFSSGRGGIGFGGRATSFGGRGGGRPGRGRGRQ